MNIDNIKNGYVIDHITAGKSMRIYRFLKLDSLDCSVAMIQNVKSERMGKKDIIKIDCDIPLDFKVLGYIDPGITVNVIKAGKRVDKIHLELPEELINVMTCKNPRCITQAEAQLDQIFFLADREKRTYRCRYCESAHKQ